MLRLAEPQPTSRKGLRAHYRVRHSLPLRRFGETEVGGTSILLLSSIGFNNFGFRADLTERALPLYTYRVLSRIPDFVPLGGMVLGGIWWITHRREEVAAAEGGERSGSPPRKEREK